MRTPHSSDNADFSNSAHLAAQSLIYPQVFGVPQDNLTFEDTLLDMNKRGQVLDGEMAIDRIVKVTAKTGLMQPITFTIQERFRRPRFAGFKDLTITEWNHNSGLPSELYKITANFFVYGYFDGAEFVDFIAADVPLMLLKICNAQLSLKREKNTRRNQSFITVTFADLQRSDCLVYWQDRREATQ